MLVCIMYICVFVLPSDLNEIIIILISLFIQPSCRLSIVRLKMKINYIGLDEIMKIYCETPCIHVR